MIVYYLLAYACYSLGAILYLLNVIEKYRKIAEGNPNPDIVFNAKIFWRKENINIIRIALLGIVTMILIVPLNGVSVDFKNTNDVTMFTTSVKVLAMPIYLIFGWSGGNATIALAGKYKESLYKQVGITETKP